MYNILNNEVFVLPHL